MYSSMLLLLHRDQHLACSIDLAHSRFHLETMNEEAKNLIT